jgi:hypothetical protein
MIRIMLDFDPMEAAALESTTLAFEKLMAIDLSKSDYELAEEDSFKTVEAIKTTIEKFKEISAAHFDSPDF